VPADVSDIKKDRTDALLEVKKDKKQTKKPYAKMVLGFFILHFFCA